MKIHWNKNGFIEKLTVNKRNIIFPWGIEFADSNSFFSLEEKGWRSETTMAKLKISTNFMKGTLKVHLSEGKFNLMLNDEITTDHKIRRTAELKALKDSWLLDFVIRYRFKKEYFNTAVINNTTIKHLNSNIYHQYETREIHLQGDSLNATVSISDVKNPQNTKPVMYVRDNKNEWIVHCRVIPSTPDKKVLKLNVPQYNKALPLYLSDLFLSNKKLYKSLEYRGERNKTSKFNLINRLLKPSAYPMSLITKGQVISLSTLVTINDNS